MRSKKVWRHYCGFCKKAGFKKPSIIEHELSCVGNPDRKCDLCQMMDHELKPVVLRIEAFIKEGLSLNSLIEAADDCPVCMLAVITQYNKEMTDRDDRVYFGDAYDFNGSIKDIRDACYERTRASSRVLF